MAEVAPAALPNRQRDLAPLQVFGQPPSLKKDSDIHLYLRRFLAYTDSIGAREDDLVALLVNATSDEVLQKIERHLHDDLTFDELSDILKRELGEGRDCYSYTGQDRTVRDNIGQNGTP